MIEHFRQFAFSTTVWLASQPFVILLMVLIVQITLIAILASTMSKRFAQHQPRLAYRIFLASIVFVLALLPIHLTLRGWTIRTPLIPAINDVSVSMATEDDPRNAVRPVGDLIAEPFINGIASAETTGTINGDDSVKGDPRADVNSKPPVTANDASITSSSQRISLWRLVPLGFVWMYVFGCLIATMRFLIGAIRLVRASRRGVELSGEYQQEFISAKNEIGLQRTARVSH
jgi:hypothetical protein